ncbi:MAG: J domain-containing protein [Actinomycetota bacterium]
MTSSHYERLGVPADSSPEQIRLAYLQKAREHHPDKGAGAPPSLMRQRETAMVAINAAWFVLRDPGRRKVYDDQLQQEAERREWERLEEEWAEEAEEPYDWSNEPNVLPPEYGGHGNPAAAIARLYTIVMFAVFIILAIGFAYAVVRSGSVGLQAP